MHKIVKVLSHKDRVSGRIISGGSIISKGQAGDILIREIEQGFFEKREESHGCSSSPSLYLPYDVFHNLRATHSN